MRVSAILCLIMIVSAPLTAQAVPYAHTRDGFTFGFSLGGGSGSWDFEGLNTDSVGGGALGLRVGYAPNSHVAITANFDNWMRRDEVLEVDVTLQTWTLTAGATVFPGSPKSWAGGFFLRGGLGVGGTSAQFELNDLDEKIQEGGIAGVLGIGYEFRLTQSFALGLSANGNAVGFDSDVIESAQFGSFILQANWYLD
jgi:hypothetical protein